MIETVKVAILSVEICALGACWENTKLPIMSALC